jgi:diadenosine tetraphosphate (Ap4A) HIT family hydrolase
MLKKILILIFALAVMVVLATFYLVSQGPLVFDPIFRGSTVQLSVPSCPLQTGSLAVSSLSNEKSITQWTPQQHGEAYNLLENIAALWREQEFIDDFMIIGTIPPRMHSDQFFWEIIPYVKNGLNYIDQISVVWNLAFNSSCMSEARRQAIKANYEEHIPFFSHKYVVVPEQTTCTSADVFCDPQVIARQQVYEGRLMRVLYNHAPLGLGEEKLHFLIIPKAHHTGFPELTLEEYLEAQEISSKLVEYYKKKGFPIVYLFHKTGKYAGQTVPHWHEHVIFAPNEKYAFWGKLQVIRKMIFGSQTLSSSELEVLVKKYRQEVQEAIK